MTEIKNFYAFLDTISTMVAFLCRVWNERGEWIIWLNKLTKSK